jgi:hypothetical protein
MGPRMTTGTDRSSWHGAKCITGGAFTVTHLILVLHEGPYLDGTIAAFFSFVNMCSLRTSWIGNILLQTYGGPCNNT